MIVETVFYVSLRKCLTDTMIASVRTGMIAVPHVAQKMRLVLTARLVVQRRKSVRTRCLPFVAPTAKHASTEAAKKLFKHVQVGLIVQMVNAVVGVFVFLLQPFAVMNAQEYKKQNMNMIAMNVAVHQLGQS